jgi:hypothetical protein
MSSAEPGGIVPESLKIIKSAATCPTERDFPSAISSKCAVNEVRATEVSLAMFEIPFEILGRRNASCSSNNVVIQFDEPDWGLDAYLWRTTTETVVKAHRYQERFQKELAAYQRLAERKLVRLKGFEFPQLVDDDEQLHILELSIVSPPYIYILDFVEVEL